MAQMRRISCFTDNSKMNILPKLKIATSEAKDLGRKFIAKRIVKECFLYGTARLEGRMRRISLGAVKCTNNDRTNLVMGKLGKARARCTALVTHCQRYGDVVSC